MSKPKVLITRPSIPEESIKKIKEKCEVEVFQDEKGMPKEELIKRISGKNGLFCVCTDTVDKEVIDAAGESLKVVSTMTAGYELIDVKYCKEKGVKVSNSPCVASNSVAEYTVMVMLCAGRRFVEATTATKEGKWVVAWSPKWMCGNGLADATVGIVGMGKIGHSLLEKVLVFNVKEVLYYDIIHPMKEAEKKGAKYVEFKDLLKKSDFVVALCNLTEQSKHMFDKEAFALMKETAVFVNMSRGAVVQQEHLYDALKNNTIRAAAIDVTVPEPLPKDHELLSLPNLIVTPHVASAESSVRLKMANLAAENILLGVQGKDLKTPIPDPK